MKLDLTVEISQPPSVVFEFLIEPENLPLWLNHFSRVSLVSGEPGEIGTFNRHFYNIKGKIVEFEETIIGVKESEFLETYKKSDVYDRKTTYTFTNIDGKSTRLNQISQLIPKGIFNGIKMAITATAIRKKNLSEIYKLKDAIEKLSDLD